MYFTVELLRCLEVLHAAGFIHADVKPDNVLLRNSGAAWEEWAPQRPGSWRQRGLALIDFGRSIDLGAHAPGTTFAGDCGTENFRCVEMQTGVPWTFQADTFGLLGCVHVMLWGSYMDVECDAASGRWRRRAPLKRYWQAELWEPLFDALLNVSSCAQQPALPQFRAAFEAHLAAPERARALRAQLMDLTILMHENATKAA
jgi:checkpoint serine/threonine-protein kinase